MWISSYFWTILNCSLTLDSPRSVTKLRNRRLRHPKNPDGSFLEISLDYRQSSGKETSARWEDIFYGIPIKKKPVICGCRIDFTKYLNAETQSSRSSSAISSSDIYPLSTILSTLFYLRNSIRVDFNGNNSFRRMWFDCHLTYLR